MGKQPQQNLANAATLVKVALVLLLSLFVLRLAALGMYPLFDTTEARYGEIARIMFETQNWVTPQFDYGVPFWGKPPFHTWLSAASFSLFGVSEFFARLPHFLVGLMTAFVVYRFVTQVADKQRALLCVFVLASTLGFILAIAMVMTDSSLLLAYTLAMTSFWLSFNDYNTKLNGHVFFAALALGMLVKGPVAVVLVVIALLIWSLWKKQFVKAVTSLPWKTGFPLFWLLVIPWYAWAEMRTPGFLEYFLVGEHIQRFLVSGWEGDLYGSAHDRPRGIIWIYWLMCAFPWSFFVIKTVLDRFTQPTIKEQSEIAIEPYLVAWMCAPMVLFSFAGNILPIYVMPGFSAMAVLIVVSHKLSKRLISAGAVTCLILCVLTALLTSGKITLSTEKTLLDYHNTQFEKLPLYYWHHRPFSAQFYSQGQAKRLTDITQLEAMLADRNSFYLVINTTKFDEVVMLVKDHCMQSKVVRKNSLYMCN